MGGAAQLLIEDKQRVRTWRIIRTNESRNQLNFIFIGIVFDARASQRLGRLHHSVDMNRDPFLIVRHGRDRE